MVEPGRAPMLEVRGLDVYYGRSHALQGVDLSLHRGVLSVVGRNGMGKTTLCKTIMGLVRPAGGSVSLAGVDITGASPASIARLGIGYVPQGRRLWRSLSVDEHLRLAEGIRRGPWTIERIYDTFPRLAERKSSGGHQLSGGEQQMLAISRALLTNPRLLIMDEPTEGLAPVVVTQVEDMLLRLGDAGDTAVLVIEQNIGVATAVSPEVVIMVNGRVNRIVESSRLAADRDLQQRLLGVGKHVEPELDVNGATPDGSADAESPSTPVVPLSSAFAIRPRRDSPPLVPKVPTVLVVGDVDLSGEELRFARDGMAAAGLHCLLVDVSVRGRAVSSDVSAREVALHHPLGGGHVFAMKAGAPRAMAEAFAIWLRRRQDVAGVFVAGGSEGVEAALPALGAHSIGVPKVVVTSAARSALAPYLGSSDATILHSAVEVQGLNTLTRAALANGAHALIGMVKGQSIGGVSLVQQPAVAVLCTDPLRKVAAAIHAALGADIDCVVLHASPIGCRSLALLIDAGRVGAVVDLAAGAVEVAVDADEPAHLASMIRRSVPYLPVAESSDAASMTPADGDALGRRIGERVNLVTGPVQVLLALGGVSAVAVQGHQNRSREAAMAMLAALERTLQASANRRLVRSAHSIQDLLFAQTVAESVRAMLGRADVRRRAHG